MDVKDDLGLGLSTPGNNFVDIEGSESETDEEARNDVEIVQKPENKSSEKINFSEVLDKIYQKYSMQTQPTSWPFLVGNQVCFRPTKDSVWFNGKIESKIPPSNSGEEIQFIISVVNDPAVTYHVPDRRDLIKSNAHTAETLNNLDLQLQPRKPSRKTVEKNKKNSEKVMPAGEIQVEGLAPDPVGQDPLTDTMVRVNKILKNKSSGRLACVDDEAETMAVGLDERMCEMLEVNRNFTGIDFANLMSSLSKEQVKTLVLSAEGDLVKVVSSLSSYQVANGF